jgi:hypothetical protein
LSPNFLIVGAEKAGTTTLATMLAQHPEVFMCTPKKPGGFFSCHNWDKPRLCNCKFAEDARRQARRHTWVL